jgi:nucleotide-binding universal stress UspA family protein
MRSDFVRNRYSSSPSPRAPARATATTVRLFEQLTSLVYDVVLLATDGSTPAAPALDRAVALAVETGATLHVLSVVDSADLDLFSDATVDSVDDLLRDAADAAVDEARTHAEEAGASVTTAVRVGTPHREICGYADDVGADVVVVGTHGRTGLSRALLGSVAARVVRSSTAPVLVVPPL